MADGAEGVLLHPAIGETVDDIVALQGHRFRFATVDLGAESGVMRGLLLGLGARRFREVVCDDSGQV